MPSLQKTVLVLIVKKSYLDVYFNKSSINGGNFGFSIGQSTVKLDLQNCLIKNVKSIGFSDYNSRLSSSIKETLIQGSKVGFRANSGQSLSLNVENCTVADNTDKAFSVRNIHNLNLSIIHTGFERNTERFTIRWLEQSLQRKNLCPHFQLQHYVYE